jgi:hypothetical protein
MNQSLLVWRRKSRMSALETRPLPYAPDASFTPNPLAATGDLLREVPKLLEYRAEADPDAEFIPKTIAGFAGGFMVMCCCLAIVMSLLLSRKTGSSDLMGTMILPLMAFALGIAGVASSLLLVALKVRADHTGEDLYARHWLNSITTGAVYAVLIAGPALLWQEGVVINRFIAAALWMILMILPAMAARWTVQPHPHLEN